MLEGVNFYYDGVYSVDMGVINCKIDGGMFEEAFLPSRELVETEVAGKEKPYFQSTKLEPLSFDLTFAFENSYDERKIREVARWLSQSYYKPFYTTANPNRIFYCMYEGGPALVHNGLKQGYINITMRCDGPYSYTPKTLKENMVFNSSKLTKTVSENTYNSEMGTMINVDIVGGNMTVNNGQVTFRDFVGLKWSDL